LLVLATLASGALSAVSRSTKFSLPATSFLATHPVPRTGLSSSFWDVSSRSARSATSPRSPETSLAPRLCTGGGMRASADTTKAEAELCHYDTG
jgi:hypothetical protein